MPDHRLSGAIEATRLGVGLTDEEVRRLVAACEPLRVGAICVPGFFVETARAELSRFSGWKPDLVTVANFPTGDHAIQRVVADAVAAVRSGADHVDVVVPGRLVSAMRWEEVAAFVREVRMAAEDAAVGGVAIKVILETAALDEARIRGAAAAAIEGGARWLKTSTGFHPAGGATLESVALLRALAPESVGVKASGGIRTREAALAMLEAGADRIGTSSEAAILGG